MRTTRRRHATRWVAGAVLLVLVVLGVVLATRTPQQATAVASPLLGRQAPAFTGTDLTTGARRQLLRQLVHPLPAGGARSVAVPLRAGPRARRR